jgi:putative peptidoglycan lipid II flippase
VRTLFERGAFSAADSVNVAKALMAYALSLPAYVAIKVYATGLYAQENTKTPVKITLVFALINTILAYALIKPLGHMGIALATSIAGWGQVLVYMQLVKQQHMLQTTDQTRHQLAWVVVACGAMAVGMAGALYMLAPWFHHGGLWRFVALALAGGFGVVLFLGLLYMAKVFRPKALWQMMRAGELE